MSRFAIALLVVLGAAAALGAGGPRPGGIAAAQPGLWDVSRSATGAHAERVCLADPADLAQWESRGEACNRSTLTQDANRVEYDYRCTSGAFGRSSITLLTPRSLRIETQGISDRLPFAYTLQARRIGNCAAGTRSSLRLRLPRLH